ncbi:hypothetical protein ACSSS7_007445 [Eimeria intestinalis]
MHPVTEAAAAATATAATATAATATGATAGATAAAATAAAATAAAATVTTATAAAATVTTAPAAAATAAEATAAAATAAAATAGATAAAAATAAVATAAAATAEPTATATAAATTTAAAATETAAATAAPTAAPTPAAAAVATATTTAAARATGQHQHPDARVLVEGLDGVDGWLTIKGCLIQLRWMLCEALYRSFLRHLNQDSASVPVQKAEGFIVGGIPLAAHPGFYDYLEVLNSWNWIYGKSPEFSASFETRFDWGSVEVGLVVVDGTIKDCRATYTAAVMHSKLAALRPHFPGNAEKIDEFAEWLAEASQS